MHSNVNSFTYTLTATPRILPRVVERLDDEAESGAAVAENVLRDVFYAGASNPDSRTTSAFGEFPITRMRGGGSTTPKNGYETRAEPCPNEIYDLAGDDVIDLANSSDSSSLSSGSPMLQRVPLSALLRGGVPSSPVNFSTGIAVAGGSDGCGAASFKNFFFIIFHYHSDIMDSSPCTWNSDSRRGRRAGTRTSKSRRGRRANAWIRGSRHGGGGGD